MADSRRGRVTRETRETQIRLTLDLDGQGSVRLTTGVPFLDHMLTLFAAHGLFDLDVEAQGDLEVDAHHTVEDLGICLGQALSRALGERQGIRRYGHAVVPMDEARAAVTLDLSNRPFLVYHTPPMSSRVGQFETQLVPEFLRAFCQHGGITLHIEVPCGANTHHILEAIFKALGRALDEATAFDRRRRGVPSSKGSL
ncbi:imidazoleglycerol-phosphate dehydratase HisB [Desulfoferrobacter suflitae]|uniref:imidazoleglycerol-phosphate dehydratase HisB n=1 Tax=Desulfoferrobacter suflitae TaxID=2865782 RepID=UPI0021642DFE|nr:imidazoleglycerol-phosphate dehydratase HisB [Desulfoferrobacter suflitae]MCK8601317.1 imidazoleglycerol-phosphate dehydratase HisB [Desulfoferrobacter suflitae]